MDLVWKYSKHLHFPGLSYRDKVSKLQEDSKTNPPRKQKFQSEAQQLLFPFDFHKYWFGVSKKVTKSNNSSAYWLQPSRPSPCPPDNMREPASLPGSVALNTLLCPSTLCNCSQQECEHTHDPCGWDLYEALHCHFLDLHNQVVHHRDAETTAQTALAAGGSLRSWFCRFQFPPISRFSSQRCVREKPMLLDQKHSSKPCPRDSYEHACWQACFMRPGCRIGTALWFGKIAWHETCLCKMQFTVSETVGLKFFSSPPLLLFIM